MKLTNKRIYLDYNATSSLAQSVKDWVNKEDLFANPSSLHSSGKAVKKLINQTRNYLFQKFSLDGELFDVFFNSGATEGINSIIQGVALSALLDKKTKIEFFYSLTDHLCVRSLVPFLEKTGHICHEINIDQNGDFDIKHLIARIKKVTKENKDNIVLLNYTWVNNDTGVVWPLRYAEKIKKETSCLVHVDAAQAIGKIDNYLQLSSQLDAYSFSGHKFGSLKGIGFTIYNKKLSFLPLLYGGKQQNGIRPGTENFQGIYSIKLALEEFLSCWSFAELNRAKADFENRLVNLLGMNGEIVANGAKTRNANTTKFIVYGKKSDLLLSAFDISGIDVSAGSACSAGSINANEILLALGYDEEKAACGIRLSFSPIFKTSDVDQVFTAVSEVLNRYL